jgi:hypothetical protein
MKSIRVAAIATFLATATVPAIAQHSYPVAKILTASDKEAVLTDVTISVDGYAEVDRIVYRHHTNLGPEFEGKNEVVFLYKGGNPICFKRITFNTKGDLQSIRFINYVDLSSNDVDISITSPGYPGDPWVFRGKSGDQEVTIRGSKIKAITFEGVPHRLSAASATP